MSGTKDELIEMDQRILTVAPVVGFPVHKEPHGLRARLTFKRKDMPTTKDESGALQQLGSSTETTAFRIQVGKLRRCLRSEVQIQASDVVVSSGLAQAEKATEIASVRPGRSHD